MRPTSWMDDAACRGMYGLHFVEDKGKPGDRQRALALSVCARCPVRGECRDYVLSSPHLELGIWAGLTERSRARVRRQRYRRCEVCGRQFPIVSKIQRLCSEQCRDAAKHARDAESKQRRRAG